MNRPLPALAAAAVAATLTAGCANPHPARSAARPPRPVPSAQPGRHRPSHAADSPTTTIAVPGPPWQPPPAAVEVARRYVTASLTASPDESAQSRIEQIVPWCTPAWAAELADNVNGDPPGPPTTSSATILGVYPSAGPGPGQRLEVTASVTVAGPHSQTMPVAEAVDVLPQPGGAWLVSWSG